MSSQGGSSPSSGKRGLLSGLGKTKSEKGKSKNGSLPCKQVKHWIKVELRWKDTNELVPAEAFNLAQGDDVEDGGPIANGLCDIPQIDPGTYDVSFPDIDAKEWERKS